MRGNGGGWRWTRESDVLAIGSSSRLEAFEGWPPLVVREIDKAEMEDITPEQEELQEACYPDWKGLQEDSRRSRRGCWGQIAYAVDIGRRGFLRVIILLV
jgi:hypothetical protein